MGSSGLIFAAKPCYSLIVTIRSTAACVSAVSIEHGPGPHAARNGLANEPSPPWEIVFAEPLGDDLSPVRGIALVGEDRGPGFSRVQKETSRESSPKRSPSPGNFEEVAAGMGLPDRRRIRMEGVRAATISSSRSNGPDDGIGFSTACVSILEHGLGLNATAEGPTGLPDGATLFAQPLALSDHCCRKRRQGRGGTGSGAGKDIEEGAEEDSHVLLFSDRVRSRTHVMLVQPDGEVAPLLAHGKVRCNTLESMTNTGCLSMCTWFSRRWFPCQEKCGQWWLPPGQYLLLLRPIAVSHEICYRGEII